MHATWQEITNADYQRVHNQPHLSFLAAEINITLGGAMYPLATDNPAATSMLVRPFHD